jgi:hypothetical protein
MNHHINETELVSRKVTKGINLANLLLKNGIAGVTSAANNLIT